MKTGLGIYEKYREFISYFYLVAFICRKYLAGFDVANMYLQRVDKNSIQKILIFHGAKIGQDCDINTGLVFHNCTDYSNLTIGENCHIGKNCFFDLRDKVIISNNVVVSMQSSFITHIDMSKSDLYKLYPPFSDKIQLKSNCYLGARSLILMGVTIGENSIVAANSMVNINVSNNSFVAGIPAKMIKKIK